ncbi:MAG: hypothetical protein H6R15_1643 [Proteobacteria bacterium]|nr:hypothetical protein [Pseudomonadota bacterium]
MPTTDTSGPAAQRQTPFLGLAPFLRTSIAGTDLRPIAQQMLALAESHPDDANLWMNLSIAMLSLKQRDIGLAIQGEALAQKRVYHLPAAEQPAKFRLLMLMAPGDLAGNTPLECLLEYSDIDLDLYYVSPENPLASPIPEHDAVVVCLGETEQNLPYLAALEVVLANWPKPVINRPKNILRVERAAASQLLQGIPGLLMPPTGQITRNDLDAVAQGRKKLADLLTDCAFPIILRPLGSHAGRDLEKIDSPAEIAGYLQQVGEASFFLAPFIDYSARDGLYRKFRVALIDGRAFACHMAVSEHWMVHYVNAGMYEDAAKRAEELSFMEHFAAFAERHGPALAAIQQRTGLDYLCLDGAETADGQLLIFEIDHAMVVHAMDPEELFPYKQLHMLKVKSAFRDFLFRLAPNMARR